MATIAELADALARLIGADRDDVRLYARRLREAGVLPESRPGPGCDGKPQASADHAAALLIALLVADRAEDGPAAVQTARRAVLHSPSEAIHENAQASTAQQAPTTAFDAIAGLIAAGRAGDEIVSLQYLRAAIGSAFLLERRHGLIGQIGRPIETWFLDSSACVSTRREVAITLPGNIISMLSDALGLPGQRSACRSDARALEASSHDSLCAA